MRSRHILVLATALFVMPLLAPRSALAEFVNISQQCSYDCLKSHCDAVGGQFGGNHTNYFCNNLKKDTRVECTATANGTVCSGQVPGKVVHGGKHTIGGILQAPSGLKAAR